MLTVEVGQGVAGANSYETLANFKAYVGTIALPAATDPEYERALVLATRYLDGKYRDRFKGTRVNSVVQSLEFPRYGINLNTGLAGGLRAGNYYSNYPSDQIPQEISDATCELALRALTAPLAADIAATDRLKRKKIDVLEWEYVVGNYQASYPVVDQLIGRFLKSSSDAIRG